MRSAILLAVMILAGAWIVIGPPVKPAEAHGQLIEIGPKTKLWVNQFCVPGHSVTRYSTRWEQRKVHQIGDDEGTRHTVYELSNTYDDYRPHHSKYDYGCDVWELVQDNFKTRLVTGGVVGTCHKDDDECQSHYPWDDYEPIPDGDYYDYKRVIWVYLKYHVRVP